MIDTTNPPTVAAAESALLAAVRARLDAEDSGPDAAWIAADDAIELRINDLRLADATEAEEIAAAPEVECALAFLPGFDAALAAQIGIEPMGANGYRVVWLGKSITFNRHTAEEANWNDALEWCLAAGERMAPVLRAQCAAPSTLPVKGAM